MWKLKIAERGNDPYVYSTNNYVGRQIWEFDPEAGTLEDRNEVEQARRHFFNNRFKVKVDSDLLWRMQFLKEKRFEQTIAPVKVEDEEDITHEKATAAMRRAAHYYSALQASDGHWPAEQSGCSFYMPPMLICLSITGHLNTIITVEHRREILRYIYCHQCCLLLSTMAPDIVGHHIEPERLYDAVNVILYLQSKNGGVTAWEPAGTQKWMEILNPVEFLAGIVVETEYVECTSSAIHALLLFKKMYPRHRKEEIENSIADAAQYIESIQKGDGSWFGNWGLCFTYGTWFAIRGLTDAGKTYSNCKAVRRGVDFLLRTQRANGGWGESQRSYPEKQYVPLEDNRSNLVQTSWALLALILSRQEDRDPKPIHQGVKLLINSQKENGDFPHEDMLGTFMKNCMVHYAAYNNIFPLWAIAEYCNRVLSPLCNTI